MHDRWDRDERDERNRGEFSGHADFGGYYARDTHRGGMGDDYARDRGWSGGGRHDQYARDDRWGGTGARGEWFSGRHGDASVGYGPGQTRSTYGDDGLGGSAAAYAGGDALTRRESFRGKGPKNWGADDRIRALINHRLTDHDGIDASDIDVAVSGGEVTLSGTAGSRWEKRLAEDIAWQCDGVHDVHNRLTVADREKQIGKASE